MRCPVRRNRTDLFLLHEDYIVQMVWVYKDRPFGFFVCFVFSWIERSCGFFHCVCLHTELHWLICKCWTNLAYLRWNQLGQGIWSAWCVFEFDLQEFYLEFMHLCSWRKLHSSFLFLWFSYLVLVSVQCWLHGMSLVVLPSFPSYKTVGRRLV